ncbi:MAG: DUF47 family protein [Eggerthellaceae bacterium]|nr:DUF47 family protein [Eggerthellaceae bacterium]
MGKKKKFDYFKAYESLSELAVGESDLMLQSFRTFTDAGVLVDTLEAIHELEHQGDDINHDIFQNAALDFMPPIDREDIVDLAQALDNVLDNVEDVLQQLYMCDVRTMEPDAVQFAELVKKSCQALDKAMEDFRNFKKSKTFKQLIVDINTYEEEGDALYLKAMRGLHTAEDIDVMHVLVWSRIYTRIEKCCDACEHAADVMNTILLKNL